MMNEEYSAYNPNEDRPGSIEFESDRDGNIIFKSSLLQLRFLLSDAGWILKKKEVKA